MSLLKEFWLAFTSYKKAWLFAAEYQLQKWIWGPGVLNLALFIGLASVSFVQSGYLGDYINSYIGLENPESWWENTLAFIIPWIIRIFTLLLFYKAYKYLMLILLSPILPMIAEKVQQIQTGKAAPEFTWNRFLSDLKRGVGLSLKNLIIELSITIPIYLVQLFAPISFPVTITLLAMIESYFLGFGLFDAHHEYLGISGKKSRTILQNHKGMTVGNGLALWLLFYVPILGVLVGPSLGVIAAGLARERVLKLKD